MSAAARRILIDIARRRQRPGSGSARAFLEQRTTRRQFPNLSAALANIPWAVVGAAATRLYMPERLTDDLDVLVREEDEAGAKARTRDIGFPVDILTGREAWTDAALAEAADNRDAQNLPILPLPYLVLMKFQASRVQDVADISRMLGQASQASLARVRTVFAHWLPGETEDLESLIALGQLELR